MVQEVILEALLILFVGLQQHRPCTGVLTGKSLEVLWKVLPSVLWEIEVLRVVLPRVLRGIGGASASAPESVLSVEAPTSSTLGSTCGGTANSPEHPREHPTEHPDIPEHFREHFQKHLHWHPCAWPRLLQF